MIFLSGGSLDQVERQTPSLTAPVQIRPTAFHNRLKLGEVKIKLCRTSREKSLVRKIILDHHSYKPSTNFVGRQIRYLIFNDNIIVGAFIVGSYVLRDSKPLKTFIGWNKEQRKRNFNKVSCLLRVCFTSKAPKNIPSKALSLFYSQVKHDWKEKYNDKLVLLVSFVHRKYKGTIFKAANWIFLGYTRGFSLKSVSKGSSGLPYFKNGNIKTVKAVDGPKQIYVKPLHRYWRRELLR